MISLVALATAASWHASRSAPHGHAALWRGQSTHDDLHGCAGTSPTGIEWAYLQPKHTGSGAVIRAIKNATGRAMCSHNHNYRRLPQHTFKSPLQGFGFTFLQTPFKRVLTSCFFHEAVRLFSATKIIIACLPANEVTAAGNGHPRAIATASCICRPHGHAHCSHRLLTLSSYFCFDDPPLSQN